MKKEIDEIDRKILDILFADGRIPVSDIAGSIGLSRPAVAERIENLEEEGFIRGYTAVLKDYPLRHPVTAFVAARHPGLLKGKAEQAVFELSRKREILEVHGVAGEDCLYLKVRVKDMQDLNQLLKDLQQSPLSMETRTTIVLNTYFEKTGGIVLSEKAQKK
ncbi:MAG: AsnC family transcriptional regulator [Acidobacteria bacterium]|nr:MAG: AsnC family transcriptional regulator [Acidobacteriota bacterium]